MRTKRTRPIRGAYWIESPRIAYKGDIISIRMKVSQVQVKYHGGAKYEKPVGGIERGSIDGEESGEGG
ncbi:MAG: hypothetical protein V3U33_00340 [candidate division NC10 bacterium]